MPSREKLLLPTEPTLIKFEDVPYVVWGDDKSHFVNDLFYVLSSQLVFVTVTLPPGGRFRSSDKFRAYFDTHECLYVLQGQYTCQDPETGETKTAHAGEMLFMPEKRWHYGYNFGSTELRLLECIAPPTNQAALAHVPRPQAIKAFDAASFSNFPRVKASGANNLSVCNASTALSSVLGDKNPVLCEVLASTDRVFFSSVTIPPNSKSERITFPFDVCYHGLSKQLHLHAPEKGEYFPLGESDVAFLPANTEHRLFNHTGATLRVLLGGAGSFNQVKVSS